MDAPVLTAPGTPVTVPPSDASEEPKIKSKATLIIVSLLIFAIIVVLIYMGYQYFNDNKAEKDGFVESQRQERSDTGGDFDLQQSIKQLEVMQSKVLSDLSNVH